MWAKVLMAVGTKLAQGARLAFTYAKAHPDTVVTIVSRVAK